MEKKNDVKMELQSKLVLENRLASLLDPSKLIDQWFAAPYNLSNTIYEQVNTYLKEIDVRKTFNARKSFLVSGHIKNVMTHSVSSSIRYCFVKGLCHLSKSSDKIRTLDLFTQRQ